MVCFQPYYKFNERKKLLKICPSLVIICLKCVAFCGMMEKRQGKMRKLARKVCEEIMNNRRLITERERPLTASGFRVMKGEREFITYQRDATIRVWHQPNPDSYAPHFHSAIEVCVPLLGGVRGGGKWEGISCAGGGGVVCSLRRDARPAHGGGQRALPYHL